MRPDAYIRPDEPDFDGPVVGELPRWVKPVTLVIVLTLLGAGIARWTAGLTGNGWEPNLAAGLEDAWDADKPVFAFFTADWCPPCRQLKRGVLRDAEVMAGLRENYVLVKVDLTRCSGVNAELAGEFNVRGIPTIILIDPRDGEFDRLTGGGPSMEAWIRSASRQ